MKRLSNPGGCWANSVVKTASSILTISKAMWSPSLACAMTSSPVGPPAQSARLSASSRRSKRNGTRASDGPPTFASRNPNIPPSETKQRRERNRRIRPLHRDRRGPPTSDARLSRCRHAVILRHRCGCGGMADAADSKSASRKGVGVQVPSPAPYLVYVEIIADKELRSTPYLEQLFVATAQRTHVCRRVSAIPEPDRRRSGSPRRSHSRTGRSPGTRPPWRNPRRSRAAAGRPTRPDHGCSGCCQE